MPNRQRRPQLYPQRKLYVPVNWGLMLALLVVVFPLVLAVMLCLPRLPAMALLAVSSFLAVSAVGRGTLRCGLSVDDDGLCERYPLGLRRRLPWSRVTALRVTAQAATVEAGTREVTFDSTLCDWRALIERCRAEVELEAAAETEPEPAGPETVATWLDLAPGEALVCRMPRRSELRRLAAGLLWLLWMCWQVAQDGHLSWVPLLVIVALGWQPGLRHRTVREVRADASGLRLRVLAGWRDVAWADLLAVETGSGSVIVQTRRGEFWLPANLPDRARLETAIRRALAARERGESLPRLAGEVPDAALSLTQPDQADAERGLSRTD